MSFMDDVTYVLWVSTGLGFMLYLVISYARSGVITFTSYHLIRYFFLPVTLLLPFIYDDQNMDAVASKHHYILDHLDEAVLISVLGFAGTVAGLWHARSLHTARHPLCDGLLTAIGRSWQTKPGVLLSFGICMALTLALAATGAEMFQAREFAMENQDSRPLFNVWMVTVSFFSVNALVYGVGRRKPAFLGLGIALAAIGLFGGTRGASVELVAKFVVMVMIACRYRNLLTFAGAGCAFIGVAILVELLRSGSSIDLEVLTTALARNVMYGNNFSDLRDFAWVLSGFTGEFYYGKTYLAGYMSIIPSSLSEFRAVYSIGKVTPMLAGLVPELHSGLRATMFGEAFLNFGYPGVLSISLIFGYTMGRIGKWIDRTRDDADFHKTLIVIWIGFTCAEVAWNFVWTPAFFTIYVWSAYIFGGYVLITLLLHLHARMSGDAISSRRGDWASATSGQR